MGKKKQQAGTPALRALDAAGVPHQVREYEHDPRSPLGFGQEAAAVLGVEPDRVFKTLVASVDGALTVAVVPVTGQLDLKALATAAGGKRAVMAEPAAAERATGYVVGGISPLGQRTAPAHRRRRQRPRLRHGAGQRRPAGPRRRARPGRPRRADRGHGRRGGSHVTAPGPRVPEPDVARHLTAVDPAALHSATVTAADLAGAALP